MANNEESRRDSLKCLQKPLSAFPSYRRFLTPMQQTAFWKHSDKRRNCSKRAISPFATMFSTFSHRLSIQIKRFSIYWQNMFELVCCRIVVWRKGLTFSHLQTHLQQTIFQNILTEGEITYNDQFLLLPLCFNSYFCPAVFKAVCCRFVVWCMWERGCKDI